jgi:hypothetical protein
MEFSPIMGGPLMGLRSQLNKGSVEVKTGDLRQGLQLGTDPGVQRRGGGELGRFGRANATGKQDLVRLAQNTSMDPPYFSGEPQYNVPHPWQRLAKPFSTDIPALTIGELAILYKKDTRNMNIMQMQNTSINHSNPVTILNPAQWNMNSAKEQLAMQKNFPDEYRRMTARDFFRDWSIDGVVETDDSTGSSIPSTQRNKILTIRTTGFIPINPYWTNVIPGSKLYMIIKKYPFQKNFILNSRFNTGGSTGPFVLHPYENIRPYQIGFYALTYGGQLPDEAWYSEDENNFGRRDALIIYIGMVQQIPRGLPTFDNTYNLKDNNNSGVGHAFVNSNENLSAHMDRKLGIIFDPCDMGM